MRKLKKALLRKKRREESIFKYVMGLLHLWMGLLSSVVLVIVCFSGCLYAFKNQISEFLNKEKVFVSEILDKKQDAAEIQKLLKSQNKILTRITFSPDKERSNLITYEEQGREITSYYNQYTGKELGVPDVKLNGFFDVVLDLHRNLLLGNVGRQINGIAVLMFCFLLFSGFILWIPKKWKHLKQALTIKFTGKFQRINYDLHNTLGFYTFLLLFFIAVTGLYVTYPWVKNAMIISLGGSSIGNVTEENKKDDAFDAIFNDMITRQDEKTGLSGMNEVSLKKIQSTIQSYLPYDGVTTIELPNNDNPRFVVTKINANNFLGAMLPDVITIDRLGELKSKDLFLDKPLDKQFISLVKPLHTGEILGLKSIILYFIVCFIGFSLPITGFIFWFNKYKKVKI